MDLQRVVEARRRRPFKPFSVALADGRTLPVTRPEAVAVGKRRIIVINPDDSCTVIEHRNLLRCVWRR